MSPRAFRVSTLLVAVVAAGAVRASDDQPSFSTGRRFDEQSGEAIYRNVCQGCHMPDGRGAAGAGTYPALANDPRLAAAPYPIVTVLSGRRNMPAFGRSLDDAQVAAVVGYVRTHFGNRFDDAVAPADVDALRIK